MLPKVLPVLLGILLILQSRTRTQKSAQIISVQLMSCQNMTTAL
ncbi:GABRE isoform 12 [Pongo abelii]|uniref:GABRE isoform 12 n=1 Tax=Pongo abelii TaxID=9601 RepID=A0A2J8S403_PONAB|nr:GABRE isoform 7 [Pongo abelii]PNJ15514.1 GABRE isoform 12 [Pongo abelii]